MFVKKIEKFSLILGSQSPRRKSLFEYLGIPFQVQISNAKEPDWAGEDAQDYTLELARLKGKSIQSSLKDSDILITSDTTVLVGKEVLNKPADRNHAKKMVGKLSNKKHYVLTSYVVLNKKEELFHETVKSEVQCRHITAQDLECYLNFNEYQDKAGAYGIQGAALSFIQKINGSYSNIVGFPIDHLIEYFQSTYGEDWRNNFA